MTSRLEELLSKRGRILADGATGTNLFEMGLLSGDAPELWNATEPDKIRSLHQRFVDAGADIILTNSFGCNRRRLALHKYEARTRELNRLAAQHARAVAEAAGRPVIVAGSVGPTGDLLIPLGPLSEDEAVEVFVEQIEGLKEGGADLVWIETMSAIEEMRAAARATTKVGMPFAVTATFDTAGRTMMGATPEAVATFLQNLRPAPVAIGANCGVGASDLIYSVMQITEAVPDAVVIAKGNCGIPKFVGEKVEYTGTPAVMAEYACLALDAGARIVGGCCGTSPGHLAAMRRALDTHHLGPRPDVARIIECIGPLAAPPPDAGAEPAKRRGGRRRAVEAPRPNAGRMLPTAS
ncbi:MAG: betaine--homocysteine S-methyltransferase [Alphaproteobacteria bacterium]|nr:betaine--homocysteine S-methyltransferase [Alphaproteobacteria bacterium]